MNEMKALSYIMRHRERIMKVGERNVRGGFRLTPASVKKSASTIFCQLVVNR